jgi:ribosome maturation factor RimP
MRSGFTPEVALPIIAALGGGAGLALRLGTFGFQWPWGSASVRFGPILGLFVESKGADGPLFSFCPGAFGMRDALMRLLEPPIEALQFELVDIEFAREGRGGILRIFIDRPISGGAVTVDDCASVSGVVSQVLESNDPIKGHYTLEVSSPGFDRILRTRAHFERFVGEKVFAELKLPLDGRRRFAGVLKSVAADTIVVEVDGKAYCLPLERIQKARLRPE